MHVDVFEKNTISIELNALIISNKVLKEESIYFYKHKANEIVGSLTHVISCRVSLWTDTERSIRHECGYKIRNMFEI